MNKNKVWLWLWDNLHDDWQVRFLKSGRGFILGGRESCSIDDLVALHRQFAGDYDIVVTCGAHQELVIRLTKKELTDD